MQALSEIIRSTIESNGPIPFRDFMELALYHPQYGYYCNPGNKIGADGDYYTAPHLTNLMGDLIGKQLEEMWQISGRKPFTIVEYGAGNGSLCRDILAYASGTPFGNQLSYRIIEKSPSMRERQMDLLKDSVSWHNSISDIGPFDGCVISNELLDNFAVHRVYMDDELMEVYVDHDNGFREVLRPAGAAVRNYAEQVEMRLLKGHYAEINLEATEWIADVACTMREGYVITIDYGYPSLELYAPHRRNGTIMCYHRHSTNNDPYTNIGEQDITAHVNFSALDLWGARHGLKYCGYTSQAEFLHCLGISSYVRDLERKGGNILRDTRERVRLIHTLLMDMGHKFKVLVQQKGGGDHYLSGLRFARPCL